ncbi:MAG: hypothetical protein WC444_05060 [Candidatus Paceibacterota bacterium]
MNIGIAGFGFVGQAVYASLKPEYKKQCIIYDPPKGFDNFDQLIASDFVFCCLPSPTIKDENLGISGLRQDFSAYEQFFKAVIGQLKNKQTVFIVKSTVLYSNILPYLSQLNIVMNPEFLNQNTSIEDFMNQKWVLLGGRTDRCCQVRDMYDECFDLGYTICEFCSEKEAIEAKYIHNLYHAYKVLFWNYVQEVTGNERKIYDLYKKVLKEPTDMAKICADGSPGFGGACFPKDLAAFDGEFPHMLTRFMQEYNHRLRSMGFKTNL